MGDNRISNNRLIAAREALCLTARAAADAIGVRYNLLLDYEGLRIDPRARRTGELRADAIEREDRETGWAHDSTRTVVVCAGCGEPTNYRHGERMTILRDGRPDVCRRTGRLELARNAIPLWEQARRRES